MEIKVRNMVCRHCVAALRRGLEQLGFEVVDIGIGHVVIPESYLDAHTWKEIDQMLDSLGFERIISQNDEIVDIIKRGILRHIDSGDSCRLKLSECLARDLPVSYDTASRIFSQTEGITIERYHAMQRIDRVKQLLRQGDLTLGEIANIMDFSSTAHLSRNFKTLTGQTPTQYLSTLRH